jgi:hypothetical protein
VFQDRDVDLIADPLEVRKGVPPIPAQVHIAAEFGQQALRHASDQGLVLGQEHAQADEALAPGVAGANDPRATE